MVSPDFKRPVLNDLQHGCIYIIALFLRAAAGEPHRLDVEYVEMGRTAEEFPHKELSLSRTPLSRTLQ